MEDEEEGPRQEWLNANVWGLAVNRFLSDFGHEAGTAVLPLFLASIGAPSAALGMIEGVADALSSVAKLYGGWLGDRVYHRRRWAAAGYLLTGVTTGLYGLLAAWPWVLLVRTVGWAGRGLRSPLHDALLTDSVPRSARGRAFGFDEAADTAGAVAGPLLALAFLGLAKHINVAAANRFGLIFVVAAIPGVLAGLSILLLVRERPHLILKSAGMRTSLGMLPPRFWRYLTAVFVFGCGDFSHTLLILYAAKGLAAGYGNSAGTIAVWLYTLHNVLYAVGAYPAGALADRFGKGRFLIVAYVLAVAMNALLASFPPSLFQLVAAFSLAGSGYALQQSLERAIAADLAPESVRSTGFGVLAAVNSVGDFFSSALVGVLWTAFSPRTAFVFAAIVTASGALLTARVLSARADQKSAVAPEFGDEDRR